MYLNETDIVRRFSFMAKTITQKYNAKKRNAEERNIAFSLTLEEFTKLLSATECAYTGESFGNTLKEGQSIERVIDEEGYHFWNCVVTTVKANQLKDIIVKSCGKLPISDVELIPRIKKSYDQHKARILKEKMMTKEVSIPNDKHSDVEVARYYAEFSINQEDFQVSFATFKRKYLKTKCELSGKEFCSEKGTFLRKAITKKDYSKAFSDDNITVICQVFDNMLKNNLFTKKELLKAADNF